MTKSGLKSVFGLLCAALLGLGCKGGEGSGPAATDSARNKDVYVHAGIADFTTLDPAWAYDSTSLAIIENVYEPLLTYKGSSVNEFEPLISEKVPSKENGLISKDGLSYTFPIRKGVKFHQGGEVTPEDVRYSILRFLLTDRAGGPSSVFLYQVAGKPSTRDRTSGALLDEVYDKVSKAVRVEGDSVVLTLNKPFSPILSVLASWAPVVNKAWCVEHGDWDGTKASWKKHNNPKKTDSYLYDHTDGTGPYQLEKWDKDKKEISLVRFDPYWRGAAKLRRAVVKCVEDFQTRRLMLVSGDADSIYADYLQLPLLKNIKGVEIIDDLPNIDMRPTVFFTFKAEPKGNPYLGSGKLDGKGIPPDFFSDLDVRKGFAYALDCDGFIRDVNGGKGSRATGFIPKGLLGYDPDGPLYPYDLKKAEEHLRKALHGKLWDKGFRFSIVYSEGNQAYEAAATMLKRAVESLNPKFSIDTKVVPFSVLLDESSASRAPMFVLGWSPDFPDPHNFAFAYMHSYGKYPRAQRYRNAQADELLGKARLETDPAKREQLYFKLQRIAHEDVPSLYILNTVRFRAQRSWVKGYIYNPIHSNAPYMCPFYNLSKS